VIKRAAALGVWLLVAGAGLAAQVTPTRVALLLAEDRRAATSADVNLLRRGARSADPLTARFALRALGRLERPSLAPDILSGLTYRYPEVRAEAANALAQALQGYDASRGGSAAITPTSALEAMLARLGIEDEASVRAALGESIGRLSYTRAEDVERAEVALANLAAAPSVTDRLGAAKGFEALVRLSRSVRPLGGSAVAALRALAGVAADPINLTSAAGGPTRVEPDPLRDARVRRLALEALVTAEILDDELVSRSQSDADPQVRRLAMRAARIRADATRLQDALKDPAPMVRLEALAGLQPPGSDITCMAAIAATQDDDTHVAVLAIDRLAACSAFPDAIAALQKNIDDQAEVEAPRAWHRAAHAIVALAEAAPDDARAALRDFAAAANWHLRVYAARAAALVGDRTLLRTLGRDLHDNVAEAGLLGLARVRNEERLRPDRADDAARAGDGGTAAPANDDDVFLDALGRGAYPVVRAAALGLEGAATRDAVPALRAALQRLITEGAANSYDTRAAIVSALTKLDAAPPALKHPPIVQSPSLNADDLLRLAAPRARVTIRDVGSFELALFTMEAPATVLRFADLAESGYYNGLTIHRVVPNFVVQGGSPGGNEYTGVRDYMRDEVGLWPHVRGSVGISTRGRDTGDAQFFVNLIDNPRFDHAYTVFAQALSGLDVIDRILEGDVIERIEILP
jgi:cyclophilin family peptidyl-prolyl cis-trans isomerase